MIIPKDPVISEHEAKAAELLKLRRKCTEIEQRRSELQQRQSDARRAYAQGLVALDGRSLDEVAFRAELREIDETEAKAIAEFRRAETELEALAIKRSQAIKSANRATFLNILRQRARALVAVEKANQAETEFHDSMRTAGVHGGPRPMVVRLVGSWSDPQSATRFHIRELKEYFPELHDEDLEK